jgi:hypothetical protein
MKQVNFVSFFFKGVQYSSCELFMSFCKGAFRSPELHATAMFCKSLVMKHHNSSAQK